MFIKVNFKNFKAFSLIELMITIITISCIVAAFTPVITKKLKNSNVTIGGNSVSDITTNCSDKFSNNCKLCTKSYCIQCELSNCTQGTYIENKSCTCKNCSDIHSNCIECDSTKCTKCKDNNYYINNGKCETCPIDKICDGINAYDKTYCTNPPEGYYCDNNVIKKCSDKYGLTCKTCSSQSCLSCNGGMYLESGSCKACERGCYSCLNSSYCLTCNSDWVIDTAQHKCTMLCNSAIPNCTFCSSSSVCTSCNGGYYVNSSKKCSPCSDIPNCLNCTSGSVCTICNEGYYINSSNKCSKCTISNCARCNTDGTCQSCNSGYYLSEDNKSCIQNDNKFNCSDSNFMRIGNLCVTRKNMGDSSTLKIPSTVTTVEANGDYCYSQSDKCCWKGTTTNTCNSSNGSYSGCNRTVCNYSAAQEICSKFNYAGKTWRLATLNEAQYWIQNTYGMGNNGLMLCSGGVINNPARCDDVPYCMGAYQNYCIVRGVWLNNTYDNFQSYLAGVYWGNYINQVYHVATGVSVRCVTEMDTE